MWRYFQRWIFGGFLKERGWINKLNNTWTPFILVILSILSFIVRYTENPVDCWCPVEFTRSMVRYANNFCWKSNRVYVAPQDDIPRFRFRETISQNPSWISWLPLVFLLQAFLFKLPGVLMHIGESKLGFKRKKLYGLSAGYTNLSIDDRINVGKQLSRYLNQWLKNRIVTDLPFGLLTFLFVFVYGCYVVNITVQTILIDKYIKDPKVMSYGTHIANMIFANTSKPWIHSPAFLNEFLCDFKIRKLATMQHYTVQCISNINLIYEQMLAFLWVWLVFTCVVTYFSFAVRVVEIIIPIFRNRYIKQYLHSENIAVHNDSEVSRFANTILGEDGVIVLKGIGDVSSEYLVRDAVINLWISHFGDRGVPLQQINPVMQANIPQCSVNRQIYNQGPSASASGDVGEEAIPLVESANKS